MDKFNLVGKQGLIILVMAMIGAAAIGFWTGYDYKAKEIRDAISEVFNEPSDDTATQRAETEPLDDLDIVKVEKGEVMEFATIDVEFLSAESTDTLVPEFGSPIVADEGTKFVIVRHKITNTTKSEFTYDTLPLLDSDDRVYSIDSDAFGYGEDNLAYETISPGVPKTGVTVFRVPADSTNFTLGSNKAGTDQFIGTDFTVK